MSDVKLLREVCNELDITYIDFSLSEKMSGIVKRSIGILQNAAGYQIDFYADNVNQFDKQLLFDLCRYLRAQAFEEFKINFSSELLMLRARYAVENLESEGNNDTEI